jgi:serine-type D-Ala-D-Ala carboxypeptidase
MRPRNSIQRLLDSGAGEGVFPGAALVAGVGGEPVFSGVAGRLSLDPPGREVAGDTVFDLGSLTKPLVTAMAVMHLVDRGLLDLESPVFDLLPAGDPGDKGAVTTRLLLCHAAGFADWRDYYRRLEPVSPGDRKARCREWILEEPLQYPPGRGCVYSDLGFMLLEWIVEVASGMEMGEYVESLFFRPLGLKRTFLFRVGGPPVLEKEAFAATERCPWRGRVLQGEVHDENAFSLGGYSGHAGLFGTAEEVFAVARLFRDHVSGARSDLFRPETVRCFFERQARVPGCGRALGWDMPSREGSSAGRFFSRTSVGHLGFPGASVWMDLDKDVQVVLLTNRIHPSRENVLIREFRPRMHDCIMAELGKSGS